MIGIEIDLNGIEALFSKFEELSAIEILRDPMNESVLLLQNYMADYPTQRNNTYTRTGTLGRTWTKDVKPISQGLEGTVGNVTKYAPWVQSFMFQARWHKGVWQTDKKAIETKKEQIESIFRNAISSYV